MGTVFVLSLLLGLSHQEYVTLAKVDHDSDRYGTIGGVGRLCDDHGCCYRGDRSLGKYHGRSHLQSIFRITHPIAKGLAFGASSHAIGTAKAMELGEVEGAMSSLAIAVTGLLTVVFSSVFAGLL